MKVKATFAKTEKFDLEIFNAKGLKIYEESFETNELNLAMGFANLPQGEYFISLKTPEGKLVKPLNKN